MTGNRYRVAAGLLLAAGLSLRLWELGSRPGWQVDEVTYYSLGRNLMLHGTLNLPIAYSRPWSPFLFHPPFYFLLLARWFTVFGAGIYQARILTVLASVTALALLTRLLRLTYGPGTALAALLFLAADGWLLYVQRISYIENALMVIIAGMWLAYRKAAASGDIRWYALAGLLAGGAAIFKHTGGYVIAALLIAWALSRRDNRGHALAVAISLAVAGVYVLVMIHLFDTRGHQWYVQQTFVQVERTLGLVQTKGSLGSPGQLLHLASQQYAVFLPSLILGLTGITLLGWRLLCCARRRNLDLVRDDILLASWLAAGVLVYGPSSLRYAQYFSLVLIPAYCYLWANVARKIRPWGHRDLVAAAMAVIVAAGLFSFTFRVLENHDNAFAAVREYALTRMPRDAVVIAESSIAYEIPQPWCSPYGAELTTVCQQSAAYIITWQTYLQSDNPFHSAVLARLLTHSDVIASFTGFSGTVKVWRIR